MIEIEALTVQFGGVRPLDALTGAFTAPVCGLIGPNGAGKTTLLNVLSGFVRPVTGTVHLDGTALGGLSPGQRVKLGLRRTFQQELVVDELTARENIQALADHVCPKRQQGREEVDRALSFMGMTGRAHVLGRQLNLFERRLIEIGKTLIGKPKAILLDEPAAGMNDSETDKLRALLVNVPARFDTQLILIDHDADLIASLCMETMVLDFGKLLALGPTRGVLDDPGVRRAYLGTE
jgi:branched-chain amino acid transport system ATP-binding protein